MISEKSLPTDGRAPNMITKDIPLAERVNNIKPSATIAIAARAESLQAEGKPIISLSIGEPDFDTPIHIKEAAIQAIKDGHTKYTAVDGIKSLKQAVCDKFERENHLKYDLNQILISCGAKHSLYNLFVSTLSAGDEVIIPAPYWVSYPDMVLLTDAKPVIVNTAFERDFKLTPEELEEAITPKTKILILNSPSNPTGKAYTRDELAALAEVLLRHPEVIVASDDIYEHHMWNNLPYANILNASPELYDRTFIINSVSKTYAMTGWRIGYTAGPAKVIAAMKKAQSQSTSNPTSISQYASIAALNGDQTCVREMTKAYHERHNFVFSELCTMSGLKCTPSDGTFYILPNIAKLLNKRDGIVDDITFTEYLLNEAEVAVIPGSAFGAPNYIRICYTTSMENLVKAMQRMRKAIERL